MKPTLLLFLLASSLLGQQKQIQPPMDEKPLTYRPGIKDVPLSELSKHCDECNPIFLELSELKPKPYSLTLSDDNGQFFRCSGRYEFCERKEAFEVSSADSTVVKLSDEEYAKLIALRQAVVDEEKRLAVKYGAGEIQALCSSLFSRKASSGCEVLAIGPHYEFHQQFLLIDKPTQKGSE